MRHTLALALAGAIVALAPIARAQEPSEAPFEIVDDAAAYPEGPLWVGDRPLATDMAADAVYDFSAGKTAIFYERGCGPTSLAPFGSGLLVLCHVKRELVLVDATGDAVRRWSRTIDGAKLKNPNDSTADGKGGVYVSDPGIFDVTVEPAGSILHLDAKGALRRVVADLHYPNGVFYDPAGPWLFVDEHLARRVLRFPVLEDGSLGPYEVFAEIDSVAGRRGDYPEAGPDGLERGPDGLLYVALYGEGRIIRLDGEGRFAGEIAAATPYVTNMAFGPDGSMIVTGAVMNAWPRQSGLVVRFPPPAPQ